MASQRIRPIPMSCVTFRIKMSFYGEELLDLRLTLNLVELPLACCLVKRQVAGTENFMEKEE